MSFLKRLFRREKKIKTEEVPSAPTFTRYVLKKWSGKAWTNYMDFDSYVAPQDIIGQLEPNKRYRFDGILPNGTFKTMWTILAKGDEDEEVEEKGSRRRSKAMTIDLSFIQELDSNISQLESAYNILGRILGKGGSSEEDLISQFEKLRQKYERLGNIFGGRTGSEGVVYKGEIPMWLHPEVIKTVVTMPLDLIEDKLKKWGVIEEEVEGQMQSSGLLKIPPKPNESESGGMIPEKPKDMGEKNVKGSKRRKKEE